jgi:hypothetical protein
MACDKKTPESAHGIKDSQLRTVERARVVPLQDQEQNDEEALEGRLQLTPMILQSKPNGEAGGNDGNARLAGTDRPKRRLG